MNTRDEIEALFEPLPKRYSVAYALSCAESVVDLAEGKDKAKVEACIDLVKRGLKGEPGLESQLESAASCTARAASVASAAYSAAYAAWVAWAGCTASCTARAASVASAAKAGKLRGKAYDKYMKEYYSKAKAFVEAIPEVERLLWL